MLALRWLLGLIGVGFAGGFLLLAVLGNAFRQTFGASPNGLLFIGAPLLALGLLLAAVLAPHWRPLLHLAAAAALGLAAFCLWQIVAEAAVVLWLGLLYLALWGWFYWNAAWGTAAVPN
jgi:hypothetical protein